MRKTMCALGLGLAVVVAAGGCAFVNSADAAADMKAVAVLTPTAGNEAHGTVTFTQTNDGVEIEAHIVGLKPNSKHAFHIHQYGDISKDDGTSAGGHFNPEGHDHGEPNGDTRHVGDLGNLEADDSGHAMYKRVDSVIALEGDHSIIGRGVIIHAGEDMFTQPTGDAGSRIAMGVVGVANAE